MKTLRRFIAHRSPVVACGAVWLSLAIGGGAVADEAAPGDLLPVVAPVANVVEREGITGAGSIGVAGDGSGRRLIALYPNHPDDFGGSVGTGAALSDDEGATWRPGSDDWPLPGTVDLWLDRLRDGRLMAFGMRWAPDPAKRGQLTAADVPADAYRMAVSEDGGQTWRPETAVIECPPEYGVIARPLFHIFEGEAGDLYMPAYAWGPRGNHALLLRSADGGRRWQVHSSLVSAAAIVGAGIPVTTPWLESSVTPVVGGEWLAVVRTGSSATAALVAVRSADGGRTWSAPTAVVAGPGRRPVAGKLPTVMRLPGGSLVLLTAHTKNHCRLFVSRDGTGRHWDSGHILTSQSGGNAGMTVTGADSLVVTSPANRRIDAWRVTLVENAAVSDRVTAPAAVTVSGAEATVTWTPPADEAVVKRYRVTPILLAPAAGQPDTEIWPYAPVETADASTRSLVLGRKLSLGGRYRFEVAAIDAEGRPSPPARSGEVIAGAKP